MASDTAVLLLAGVVVLLALGLVATLCLIRQLQHAYVALVGMLEEEGVIDLEETQDGN